MLTLVLFSVILLTLLIFLWIRKGNDPGIPFFPERWPILGHLHLFVGDNVRLYDTIKNISMKAIENHGCVALDFCIFKYYLFTDPDDVLTILNSATEKHYAYYFSKTWLGDGLLTAPPHIWQVQKKLLSPMFQQQNLNKFLIVFNNQGKRMVKQFSDKIGKGEFNHAKNALLISLETICQTALGSNVGEEMARNTDFCNSIDALMNCIIIRFKKVWLHFQSTFKMSSLKIEHDKHIKTINTFSKELVHKRKCVFDRVSETVQNDIGYFTPFVDTMLKISLNNDGFKEKQILDEINTFIIAGYDTTAYTIVYSLMLLGHHQVVQEKVYKELLDVFGTTDRDVDKYDLPKLIYLEAVIKEALRLYTITPIIARKVNSNLKLKNYTIPAGTDCFLSLYGLHRNPEWGDDVMEFNPDRWMNPETLPKNPNLYAPFGSGRRNCIGKTYAMMSLKTTLAHLLRHYRIKADINRLVVQMVILIKPAYGHHIVVEPRNPENIKANTKA